MNDVEPCELLSQPVRQQLNISPESQERVESPPGIDGKGVGCYYILRTGEAVFVNAATNHGVDRWSGDSAEYRDGKEVARVAGYRTIRVIAPKEVGAPKSACRLYVDVSDGQALEMDVRRNVQGEKSTCEVARDFAKAALESLTSQ